MAPDPADPEAHRPLTPVDDDRERQLRARTDSPKVEGQPPRRAFGKTALIVVGLVVLVIAVLGVLTALDGQDEVLIVDPSTTGALLLPRA